MSDAAVDPCANILLTIGGAFVGCSPVASFEVYSPNMNEWTGTTRFGAIAGFAAFGIAYIITVISIFHDIHKSYHATIAEVEEDKKEIDRLEQHLTPDEKAKAVKLREEELARRLAGKKVEDKGDDQLLGEAVKLNYNRNTKTATKN